MTEMKSASPGRAKKRWSLADPNIVRLLKMLRPYKKWIIYAVIALDCRIFLADRDAARETDGYGIL